MLVLKNQARDISTTLACYDAGVSSAIEELHGSGVRPSSRKGGHRLAYNGGQGSPLKGICVGDWQMIGI